MKVKREWTECDVCQKPYYTKSSTTKVGFGYDSKRFKFDCCYECLRGRTIRDAYRFMANHLKKLFYKGNDEEKLVSDLDAYGVAYYLVEGNKKIRLDPLKVVRVGRKDGQ